MGSQVPEIRIIGLTGLPLIKKGDNIAELIVEATKKLNIGIEDGDILIVCQKIVSKAEGRVFRLDEVKPSPFAEEIAKWLEKDPRLVEIILREARGIVRMGDHHLITQTKHGFVCANSAVDRSNVNGGKSVTTLPVDPDESARRIRGEIKRLTGRDVAVIISDTHGRPFRKGAINVAVGVAGMKPIRRDVGKEDLFSYVLKTTYVAVADELASAAELIMGQSSERIPVVIIKGYRFEPSEEGRATDIVRPMEKDLFY